MYKFSSVFLSPSPPGTKVTNCESKAVNLMFLPSIFPFILRGEITNHLDVTETLLLDPSLFPGHSGGEPTQVDTIQLFLKLKLFWYYKQLILLKNTTSELIGMDWIVW